MSSFPQANKANKSEARKSSKTTRLPDYKGDPEDRKSKRTTPFFPDQQYEIIRKDPDQLYTKVLPLGIGSFGTVYESTSNASGKKVAVKTVKEDDKHTEADLKREIGFLRHCAGDFICAFHEAYFFDGKLTIVLEFFECGSVHDLMKMAKTTLSEDFIKAVAAQSLLGLQFLQSKRVMHRDVKAGNILLSRKGQSKLCDFGVSRLFPKHETHTKTIIGTPYWMAPEIVTQIGYSYNADVWSLGVTMIEMNDGNPPFSRIDPLRAMFLAQRRPPPKFMKRKNVSTEMIAFLARCVTKEKETRPIASEIMQDPFIHPTVEAVIRADPIGASEVVRDFVDKNIDKVIEFRTNTKFVDDENLGAETELGSSDEEGSFIKIGRNKPNKAKKANRKNTYRDNLVRRDKGEGSLVQLGPLDDEDDGEIDDESSIGDFNSFIVFDADALESISAADTLELKAINENINTTENGGNTDKPMQASMPQVEYIGGQAEPENVDNELIRKPTTKKRGSKFKRHPSKARLSKLHNHSSFSTAVKKKSKVRFSTEDESFETKIFDEESNIMIELHRQLEHLRKQSRVDVVGFGLKFQQQIRQVRASADVSGSKTVSEKGAFKDI